MRVSCLIVIVTLGLGLRYYEDNGFGAEADGLLVSLLLTITTLVNIAAWLMQQYYNRLKRLANEVSRCTKAGTWDLLRIDATSAVMLIHPSYLFYRRGISGVVAYGDQAQRLATTGKVLVNELLFVI